MSSQSSLCYFFHFLLLKKIPQIGCANAKSFAAPTPLL